MNFSASIDVSLCIVCTYRLGWYPLFAKNGDIPVIEDGLLL